MPQREQPLPPEVRLGIARDGERIDVTRLGAGHRQARADRLARKAGVVLDAAESLFLDGRHELAVAQDGGGDVAVVRVDAEDEH